MKKVILFVLLALLLVGCGISKDEYNAAKESAQKDIDALESQLETAQGELNSTKDEAAQLETELASVKAYFESVQSELGTVEEEAVQLTDELAVIKTDYISVTHALSDTQSMYDVISTSYGELEDSYNEVLRQKRSMETDLTKHICNTTIADMKYKGIMDVSTILMGWYARQPNVERVHNTYRDTIWSNTDTKIHSVRFKSADDGETYVEHFLVYFDEFGWKEGVYWLSEQCWLTGGP